MSSASLSSKKNSTIPIQGQMFHSITNPASLTMKNLRSSPDRSTITTRIVGPRPFYRSRMTPEPFDYTNHLRRKNDDSSNGRTSNSQRRYSVNFSQASSPSNSHLSESETSTLNMTIPSINPSQHYRSSTPTPRPVVNLNSTPTPFVKMTPGASPNRSEVRFLSSSSSSSPSSSSSTSSSSPNNSTVRTISLGRPHSPSIFVNRATNNHLSTNHEKPFQISLPGSTTKSNEPSSIPMFGQLSSIDRTASNVVSNRFKPLVAYTTATRTQSPIFDGITATRRMAPIANSSYLRQGNLVPKNGFDPNHLSMKNRCARCHEEILGEENGLVAMNRIYHVACFTCTMCGSRLRGMHFYSMENQPYCEPCFINSLEKCFVCSMPITDRVLRATGKAYHAHCFTCSACHKSLDGVPFTIDIHMDVHCIECFHEKFAPRCAACHRTILPSNGHGETLRIVAFDRNYHLDCYRCQNCQCLLNNEHGCHPIDDHIFCLHCYCFYSKTILNHN